ncbi:MAG: DNA packaging protein [Lysobacter sp.]
MEEISDRDANLIIDRLSDRWWRLNNLYWIVDKFGRPVKFQPNAVQAELDDSLHLLNICLKSRQHGVTTWACIRALDMCLFRSNSSAGIVAHTGVDARKFFRKKVLYAYDRLPAWLRAERSVKRRDLNEGTLELSNDSSLEVSVSHRGGTLQFLHISEYGPMCAKSPQAAEEVASGALNAVAPPTDPTAPPNIIVIESTAHGASGDFFDRCEEAMEMDRQLRAGTAKLTAMDYRFHFFGWFQDPINYLDPDGVHIGDKDAEYFEKVEREVSAITRRPLTLTAGQKAWYVKKKKDQREKMAREHPSTPDEAFRAAIEGAYYGVDMADADEQGRICDLPINPSSPVHTFWDIGHSDTTAIWFMQENGPWFDFIDYYEMSHQQVAHFAKVLKLREYVYGKHYWPHDGDNTDWSAGEGKTRCEIAEGLGIKPIEIVERIQDITEGIDMVRQVLHRCRFHKTRCGPPAAGKKGRERGGIEALRHYSKDFNEKLQVFSDHPRHDWASNGADAFRQFAQGFRSKATGRPAATKTPRPDSWRTA